MKDNTKKLSQNEISILRLYNNSTTEGIGTIG